MKEAPKAGLGGQIESRSLASHKAVGVMLCVVQGGADRLSKTEEKMGEAHRT